MLEMTFALSIYTFGLFELLKRTCTELYYGMKICIIKWIHQPSGDEIIYTLKRRYAMRSAAQPVAETSCQQRRA